MPRGGTRARNHFPLHDGGTASGGPPPIAFGAALVDQPAMTGALADLALESEAATTTALMLARAHDADQDDDDDEDDEALRRLATAVAKFWVCKRGPGHAYEAMECLAATATWRSSRWPGSRRR